MCLKEKIKGKRQGEGRGREKSQSNMEARTEDTACSPLIHQSPWFTPSEVKREKHTIIAKEKEEAFDNTQHEEENKSLNKPAREGASQIQELLWKVKSNVFPPWNIRTRTLESGRQQTSLHSTGRGPHQCAKKRKNVTIHTQSSIYVKSQRHLQTATINNRNSWVAGSWPVYEANRLPIHLQQTKPATYKEFTETKR